MKQFLSHSHQDQPKEEAQRQRRQAFISRMENKLHAKESLYGQL